MGRFLLDTHAAIWFFNGDTTLSVAAKQIILDPLNVIHLSIASAWELAIKISLGKLEFAGGAEGFVRLAEDNGFAIVPIKAAHLGTLEKLPFHHRDPFDRLLIAAAFSENLAFITIDKNVAQYKLPVMW